MLSSPLLSLSLHLSDKIPLCPMTRWLTWRRRRKKKTKQKKHRNYSLWIMFIFLSRLKLLSKINKQRIHQKTKKALITTITSIKIRKKKKHIGNPNKLTPQESPSIPEENIFNLEQLDISLQLTVHILKELCNKINLLSVFLRHFTVLFVIAVMERSSKESFY